MKKREVGIAYRSIQTFYTLQDQKFTKTMTPNRMVVHNNPLYRILQDLPLDKQSIHDIRLRFKVSNIWKIFSLNRKYPIVQESQDIHVASWNKNNAIVRIVIHKTDTVSITIGCSLYPIPLDANGIIGFFNLLVRVEENLQNLLDNSIPVKFDKKCYSIPEYMSWLVMMWHFGRDGLSEYGGERLCVTLATAQNILTRLYGKDFNGKNRIRIERQEYPNVSLVEAINDKLNDIGR